MHRLTACLLAISIVIGGASSAHADGYVHHGQRPCSGWQYDLSRPATRTTRGPRLVRCVFATLGMADQADTAVAISDRETGGTWDPEAYNPSGCGGIFQMMLRYWPGRRVAYLPRWLFPRRQIVSWANPLANVWVAARMVKAGGWSPWAL